MCIIFFVRMEAPCFSKVWPFETERHASSSIPKHQLFFVKLDNLFSRVCITFSHRILFDKQLAQDFLHGVDSFERFRFHILANLVKLQSTFCHVFIRVLTIIA